MRPPNRTALLVFGLLLLDLLLLTSATPARGDGTGLSVVGAQGFGNENLLFFVPEDFDHFGHALAAGDFNGDGVDDLATGIPFDNGLVANAQADCGGVVVRYGVAGAGLATGLADTFLSQQASGSLDPAEPGDRFGEALAVGDFNGDGIDDLAVGIPGETLSGHASAGAIQIHYGLPNGIQLAGEHFLHQGTPLPGAAETSDGFGLALAVGNFNGDAYDDLAVGAPGDFGGSNTGSVTVLNGGAGGLMPFDGYLIHQDQPGIFDSAEAGDLFGHALATGDFDGNGFDDLAIGVPGEDGVGAVQVIFGSAFGLIFTENLIWRETNIGGASAAGDRFGNTLAAGDFDGDGHADLAIGVPWKNLGPGGTIGDSGVVFAIFGSPFRFDLSRTRVLAQVTFGSQDESGDLFGFGLETGDFDADGRDDLVIAAPFEDLQTGDAGQISILMGAASGFTTTRYEIYNAGLYGVPGSLLTDSTFGRALASGDFDGDGHADLAIGAPNDSVSPLVGVGTEMVLYGALFADGFEGQTLGRWSSWVD